MDSTKQQTSKLFANISSSSSSSSPSSSNTKHQHHHQQQGNRYNNNNNNNKNPSSPNINLSSASKHNRPQGSHHHPSSSNNTQASTSGANGPSTDHSNAQQQQQQQNRRRNNDQYQRKYQSPRIHQKTSSPLQEPSGSKDPSSTDNGVRQVAASTEADASSASTDAKEFEKSSTPSTAAVATRSVEYGIRSISCIGHSRDVVDLRYINIEGAGDCFISV